MHNRAASAGLLYVQKEEDNQTYVNDVYIIPNL